MNGERRCGTLCFFLVLVFCVLPFVGGRRNKLAGRERERERERTPNARQGCEKTRDKGATRQGTRCDKTRDKGAKKTRVKREDKEGRKGDIPFLLAW